MLQMYALDLKDLRGHRDLRVERDLRGPQVRRDFQDQQPIPAARVLPVRLERRDLRELPERLELRDRRALFADPLALQATLDQKEFRDRQPIRATRVPCQPSQAPQVPRAFRGRPSIREPRVVGAWPDPRELLA